MNFFLTIIFYSLIVAINANFNIIYQIPNTSFVVTTQQFQIEIDQPVNRPKFVAFINVSNATSNASIYQIDVHNMSSNANYSNYTLTFYIPPTIYSINSEFYITFDAGVLFSNTTTNSSALNDTQFWRLKVLDMPSTTGMTNLLTYTSMGTTYNGKTGSTIINNIISTMVTTAMMSTSSSMTQTVQSVTTQTTANVVVVATTTGESPATRSARLGMGFGITFITVIIICEIIYFKYFYRGTTRSGSYYT
ncbi:unnamed protein product [Adineta steineri]|uniref:Uncharacterized protein n=1 Tax=Adineta steineri TaxID=433720 RepID=A0A815LGG9_9BILA|nr:unnamed protein product [Adineta steineri]CAF3824981.1 unnamed protein product [Adineta steineri]